jgi:hypothetical protein
MALDGRKANLSPEAAGYITRLEAKLLKLEKALGVAVSGVTFLKNKTSGYISKMKPGFDGVPFAQAAGIATPAALATNYTVLFPTGRFTQPPVILLTIYSGSVNSIGTDTFVSSSTSDQFTYRCDGGTFHSSLRVHWQAIQMTTDTANG